MLETVAEIRGLVQILLLALLIVWLLVENQLLLIFHFVRYNLHVQMRYLAILLWSPC